MMGTGISSLSTLPNTFTETEETPQMKIVLVGVPNSGKTYAIQNSIRVLMWFRAFFTSIIDPGIGLYRRHMRNKKMRDHFEAFTSFGEIHQICGHDFPMYVKSLKLISLGQRYCRPSNLSAFYDHGFTALCSRSSRSITYFRYNYRAGDLGKRNQVSVATTRRVLSSWPHASTNRCYSWQQERFESMLPIW